MTGLCVLLAHAVFALTPAQVSDGAAVPGSGQAVLTARLTGVGITERTLTRLSSSPAALSGVVGFLRGADAQPVAWAAGQAEFGQAQRALFAAMETLRLAPSDVLAIATVQQASTRLASAKQSLIVIEGQVSVQTGQLLGASPLNAGLPTHGWPAVRGTIARPRYFARNRSLLERQQAMLAGLSVPAVPAANVASIDAAEAQWSNLMQQLLSIE